MDATVYKLADKFNSDSKIAVDSMASGTNKSFSAYVMDEHKFSDRWTATAGLRYDKWSTDGRILLPNKTEAIPSRRTETTLNIFFKSSIFINKYNQT